MTSRRAFLRLFGAAAALAPPLLTTSATSAMGRIPYGGRLRLHLPLNLEAIDPHDLFSLEAAVLGSALFEPLYALDESGRPYPTLAARLPEAVPGGIAVELRSGLTTAAGRALTAADLEFSVKRAAASGAKLLLLPFGAARPARGKSHTLVFPRGEPRGLATALASPLTALVPRGFTARRPDGTGPFGVSSGAAPTLRLLRNPRAARGGAYLDRIDVQRSSDLASALRAFEAGEADVGWLASGLHRARQQASKLDAGPLGWVVLCTGRKLGPWSAPGVAQAVLDAAGLTSLSALGLTPLAPPKARGEVWRGPPSEVLVAAEAPQLSALARSLVEALGGPTSGLTVTPVTSAALAARRATGDYALLLDFVRVLGGAPGDDARAILTAAALAAAGGSAPLESPRAAPPQPLREITRRLRLGIVGALRLTGAHLDKFARLSRWHLGDVYERPASTPRAP